MRDGQARARINARIRRLSVGIPRDTKSVGGGVSEMRIDYGPGYRVYFVRRGEALVISVAGGDKRTQNHDVAMAIKLARDLEEHRHEQTQIQTEDQDHTLGLPPI
jgi:putative addiction module killer protein